MVKLELLILFAIFIGINGRILLVQQQRKSSDFVHDATKFGPIPQPLFYKSSSSLICIDATFEFRIGNHDCPLLRNYVRDIHKPLFNPVHVNLNGNCDTVSHITVSMNKACNDSSFGQKLYPTAAMDETYQLNVSKGQIHLSSNEIWGAMRGLETFSQLAFRLLNGQIAMFDAIIIDQPRFQHRGLMIDTSRHFLHKKSIFDTLRLMAMTKFNVLHWHIVDDQSFPYSSTTYPDMSQKGAYNPYDAVYTQEDIADVIEYARRLGIRVIPEFDTPGHTLSWGKSQASLLTKCYSAGKLNGQYGPIDPSSSGNYDFLSKLFSEIIRVFPDTNVHLGGDEVPFGCWKSNPNISAFMKKNNISTYNDLESYYINRLIQVVNAAKVPGKSLNTVLWQEVFDNKVKIPENVIVHVWKDPWQKELAAVTKAGYTSLLSTCWYLNYISYGNDYAKYYNCDPQNFNGTAAQKKLVIGGEACMWGEFVDDGNLISRTWPRASSVAEALWTMDFRKDVNSFTNRIQSLQCRMVNRGFPAQPINGPSSCDKPLTVPAAKENPDLL